MLKNMPYTLVLMHKLDSQLMERFLTFDPTVGLAAYTAHYEHSYPGGSAPC